MRVSAGTAKGTHLRAPRAGVRPTSDRVKEALFNSLAPRLEGARVLDLFAGTGALGIEALSRGAARAVFLERDPRAVAAIRRNLDAAHLDGRSEVRRGTVPAALHGLEREGAAFDLIVLDPPYGQDLPARTLRRLAASPLLTADGIVAAEGHWRDDPGEIPGLRRIRDARYGETGLWFYARAERTDRAVDPGGLDRQARSNDAFKTERPDRAVDPGGLDRQARSNDAFKTERTDRAVDPDGLDRQARSNDAFK